MAFHVLNVFNIILLILGARYAKNLDSENLKAITTHDAAKGVYGHTRRFHNTDKDITGFWAQIITESNNSKPSRTYAIVIITLLRITSFTPSKYTLDYVVHFN